MTKLLPFVNKPAEEIEVVGNENIGLLYFLKRHGVTPNENPADLQQQQKKQQRFLLRLNRRIKELAHQEGVDVKVMRKRVMGSQAPGKSASQPDLRVFTLRNEQDIPLDFEDTVCIFKKQGNWLVYAFSNKGVYEKLGLVEATIQRTNQDRIISDLLALLNKNFSGFTAYPSHFKTTLEIENKIITAVKQLNLIDFDEEGMLDYLDDETAELLFNLQESKPDLAIRAATYMVKYRVVYPIIVLNNSVAGTKNLFVESVQAPVEAGTVIKFGPNKFAKVTETLTPSYGAGETLFVDELPFELKEHDVGFLCEPGTRKLQVGYAEWEEDDTRDDVHEEMISLLFNFYQKEAGIVADFDESSDEESGSFESEGNLLNPSNEPLPIHSSTGETSTTVSNGSESETNASTTRTLVASQLG